MLSDDVRVPAGQIDARNIQLPQVINELRELQRKIQQPVFNTVIAEEISAGLRVVEDVQPFLIAGQGRLQPLSD